MPADRSVPRARRGILTTVAIVGCVGLFALAIILAAAPEVFHFDGALGSGCDAGNRYCTYSNWVRACDEFTKLPSPKRCRFIYDAERGAVGR